MITDFNNSINNPAIRGQVSTGNPPALSNPTYYVNQRLKMLRSTLTDFKLLKDANKELIPGGNNGSATWVRFAPTVTNLVPLGDDPTVQNQINGVGAIEYEVTTNNYGLHRVFADRAYRLKQDPAEVYRREIPLNHMETLEEITRNHLITNSDPVYAAQKSGAGLGDIPISVGEMNDTCTPDIREIQAIVDGGLRPKLIPFYKSLGSRYRVLASIGVRSDLNQDSLVIQQMDFDQDAGYITTPQNERDIKLLQVAISEYAKTYVSQPGAPDLNGQFSGTAVGDPAGGIFAHHSLIYGSESFGIGFMKNMGQNIVKKSNNQYLGDPLNRIRETQGWKVDDFGVVVLSKVYDYISVPTSQGAFQFNTDQTMLREKDIAAGGSGVAPEVGNVIQPDIG